MRVFVVVALLALAGAPRASPEPLPEVFWVLFVPDGDREIAISGNVEPNLPSPPLALWFSYGSAPDDLVLIANEIHTRPGCVGTLHRTRRENWIGYRRGTRAWTVTLEDGRGGVWVRCHRIGGADEDPRVAEAVKQVEWPPIEEE